MWLINLNNFQRSWTDKTTGDYEVREPSQATASSAFVPKRKTQPLNGQQNNNNSTRCEACAVREFRYRHGHSAVENCTHYTHTRAHGKQCWQWGCVSAEETKSRRKSRIKPKRDFWCAWITTSPFCNLRLMCAQCIPIPILSLLLGTVLPAHCISPACECMSYSFSHSHGLALVARHTHSSTQAMSGQQLSEIQSEYGQMCTQSCTPFDLPIYALPQCTLRMCACALCAAAIKRKRFSWNMKWWRDVRYRL